MINKNIIYISLLFIISFCHISFYISLICSTFNKFDENTLIIKLKQILENYGRNVFLLSGT